jgi:hypothetical protein
VVSQIEPHGTEVDFAAEIDPPLATNVPFKLQGQGSGVQESFG